MPQNRKSNTLKRKPVKSNNLKVGLLIFIISFVVLGGFYLIWRSFAAVGNGRVLVDGLYTANPDGTKLYSLRNIPNGYFNYSAVMTQDGKNIFYRLSGSDMSIYSAEVQNYDEKAQGQPLANIKKVTTLPPGYTTSANKVVLSPNGQWVGTLTSGKNYNGIWIAKTDGTGGRLVSGLTGNSTFLPTAFAWLPDSTNIIYTPYPESSGTLLCKINMNGTNNKCNAIKVGTSTTLRLIIDVAVAANGLVALSSYNSPAGEKNAPSADIYTMNSDGTNIKKLTNQASGEQIQSFAWSPDNSKIMYSFSSFRSSPYVMNANGTNKQRLVGFNSFGYLISSWTTAPIKY